MFHFLGRQSAAHPYVVGTLWLVLGGLLTLLAPNWDARTQDDDIRFLPDRCPSVRGHQLLEKAFPQDIFASRLIFALERVDGPLTEKDFTLVNALCTDLEQLRDQAPELK